MDELGEIKYSVNNIINIDNAIQNASDIAKNYEIEEKLMLAVQLGDVNKAKSALSDLAMSRSAELIFKRFADPLRSYKNVMIILNTLLRTAAKKGGLPIIYLHSISEKYALIIENTHNIDFLRSMLSREMILDYTNAVAMFSTSQYSEIIKRVIEYISFHITTDINLKTISKYFNMNASYLSRKFKEETKMTISKYINYQRVELSKIYFENKEESITEVAHKVGYSDSSYFAKVFKKITGISPKEYIRNLRIRG